MHRIQFVFTQFKMLKLKTTTLTLVITFKTSAHSTRFITPNTEELESPLCRQPRLDTFSNMRKYLESKILGKRGRGRPRIKYIHRASIQGCIYADLYLEIMGAAGIIHESHNCQEPYNQEAR